LKENNNNVICPIKLLLILALRLGNVHAKTIDEVLWLTAQRRDKTVIWAHLTRPILCAFDHSGRSLKPDKPAGNHQLTHIMSEASQKAGFLARVVAHDLRVGAARDSANLNNPIKGHATLGVATAIGHSETFHAKGTTSRYTGSIAEDVWTKRVEENFEDPFGVEITGQSFKRRRLNPSEITQMCEANGVDSSDPKIRKNMSRLLHK
jgi:hypothetical protein